MVIVNSVKIPVSHKMRRALRSKKNHLDGCFLDAYDLEQYDYDTVFYDVFLDQKNHFLYTIGPPFLNLGQSLFPISCLINNDRARPTLQITEYYDHKIAIGKISLKNIPLYNENSIELDFNGSFNWRGTVEFNRHEAGSVVLTTIQKDNRIRWIKEWIDFYSKNYGVDQIIIYDNKSSNRKELEKNVGDNVLIVEWDYKYGPIRSHDNQFCQLGSLNHCRLKFGSNNLIMNFDIDELLYLRNPNLGEYVKRYDLTLFDGYRVPFVKPICEDYSYKDFSFRDSDPQEGGRKYIYKPENVMVNNIHSALLKSHRISLYRRMETLYYRLFKIYHKSCIYRWLLNLMLIMIRLKVVPFDEGYFLHYTGITNNWKSRYWNRKEETKLSDKHIKFDIFKL